MILTGKIFIVIFQRYGFSTICHSKFGAQTKRFFFFFKNISNNQDNKKKLKNKIWKKEIETNTWGGGGGFKKACLRQCNLSLIWFLFFDILSPFTFYAPLGIGLGSLLKMTQVKQDWFGPTLGTGNKKLASGHKELRSYTPVSVPHSLFNDQHECRPQWRKWVFHNDKLEACLSRNLSCLYVCMQCLRHLWCSELCTVPIHFRL